MDGTLVLHILLMVILFLGLLVCRIYCRKRNRHKTIQFMISRIHPLRVTPVLTQSPPHFGRATRTMSIQVEPSAPPLTDSTCPNSAEPSVPSYRARGSDNHHEDQISLESHTVPNETSSSTINTADDVKSPPPPYSAGELPSYEDAIRWSKSNKDLEVSHAKY